MGVPFNEPPGQPDDPPMPHSNSAEDTASETESSSEEENDDDDDYEPVKLKITDNIVSPIDLGLQSLEPTISHESEDLLAGLIEEL